MMVSVAPAPQLPAVTHLCGSSPTASQLTGVQPITDVWIFSSTLIFAVAPANVGR